MQTKRIYSTSTEDVFVPVAPLACATPLDPTLDVVQMAFIPLDQDEPGAGDWNPAAWETCGSGLLAEYLARCLVGPAGGVTLGSGLYQVFVKITDSPEVPVKQASNLLQVV